MSNSLDLHQILSPPLEKAHGDPTLFRDHYPSHPVELKGLLKKRTDFIAKKNAELKKSGKLKGFDAQVQNLIREQAAPKGIAY